MFKLTDLAQLMEYIGSRYTFTADHYPRMTGLDSDGKKAFVLSHSVHHIQKSVGKLAAECEHFDHGGKLDDTAIREGVVKMFINSVKLAEEMGITAEELAASVPTFMASK